MKFITKHKFSFVVFISFFLFYVFIISIAKPPDASFYIYLLPIIILSITPSGIVFIIEVIIYKLKKHLDKKSCTILQPEANAVVLPKLSNPVENFGQNLEENNVVEIVLVENTNEQATSTAIYNQQKLSNDNTFVAIDFETATSKNYSACSIGIVVVTNGKVMNTQYHLIQPPNNEYSNKNISIHSITPNDTALSPFFSELWPKISHFFDNTYVVAHNAPFDMSVLKATLNYYNIPFPSFKYFCSMSVGFKYVDRSIFKSKKLVDLCSNFNIALDNHHNALSDARACAEIVICSMSKSHFTSFNTFIAGRGFVKNFDGVAVKDETVFMESKFPKKISISSIKDSIRDEDISLDSDFDGKSFVFTGDIDGIEREDAYARVIASGGIVKSGISKKVDYLVSSSEEMTGKLKAALTLQESGHHIKIIDGYQFMEMLENTEAVIS